ncbi:MAG: putative flippase GtrA [Halioglobus sp.]|jgi:putative flippase GtrA
MNSEIVKYGVCGGLAFAVDFTVLYSCTEFLGFHYLISNILGYGSGLMVAYLLNTRWVFSYRRFKRTSQEFLIFNGIVLLGLGISEAIMALLVGGWGIHYLASKVVAAFFVMIFNYMVKKRVLFTPAAQDV